MPDYTLIELLEQQLKNGSADIKAEPKLTLAIEAGLGVEDFIVSPSKRFIREFSRDVISADLKEISSNLLLLQVLLSRAGIFDQLPEGLFFRPNQRRIHTVAEMAADYKANKKHEDKIRKFFIPFEHDFFLQRIAIEQEESRLLEGLHSGNLNEYFIAFWNLPGSIPKQFLSPLILLLPHAYKIAGDMDLTAESLELILNEKVKLVMREAGIENAESVLPPVLGEGLLGLDMVCGESFLENNPTVEIQIGPLENSLVTDYLEHGNRFTLLETFTRFFIPAGVDSSITINVKVEKQHMTIKHGSEPVLGYTSYL